MTPKKFTYFVCKSSNTIFYYYFYIFYIIKFYICNIINICIMLLEKTNISARVEITLKKIVEDSAFTHKDAYELGAKLIAIDKAQDTIAEINTSPDFKRIIKETEYRLIEARKEELERELRDL